MGYITDLPLFLTSVVLISIPLVVSPGPVFAVTVAKGYSSKWAGAMIALGHGAIEFPLIMLLYLGLSEFLNSNLVHKTIGFIGGSILLYMGLQLMRTRDSANNELRQIRHSSFIAGLVASANPFFFISWATVGAAMVENAAIFGFFGLITFALTHWAIDLIWTSFVSVTIYKSRRFWTPKVFRAIFIFCALILVGFGLFFILSSFL
ncbi:MAG: LysE family translocator [Candidatus Bathyarchaeota archaeon]|nr:LysE family translocator [Candidatus Bathyarchaeota archaeon]MCX8176918.1 LysE family translocator [Candidatus Bathyarchaeota archaeon]MDW8193395.1 LysE family transporter [Nitrososphaerota archaeon]